MNTSFPPQHLRHPAVFLAAGFGSGLAPKAPGTFGTLAGLLLWLGVLAAGTPLWLQALLVLVACVGGVWLCEQARRQLGVDDHPGIVWDEIAGLWLALLGHGGQWWLLLAGFALFRLFDIAKPWPVGWADRRLKGGFGIMVDDLLAALLVWPCLWLLRHFIG